MKYVILVLMVASFTVAGFVLFGKPNAVVKSPTQQVAVKGLKYLPLGDSYTIGQSISQDGRWPNQLVSQLATEGQQLTIVDNPSVTGYTTQDLIDHELRLVKDDKPDFVTVQIGVNDWVQGVPAAKFKHNLDYIIDQIVAQIPDKTHLLLVNIPDYGLTPTGSRYGTPAESHAGVVSFNKIIQEEATARGLMVADIFPASQKVSTDPSLVAGDGLHPSAKQYTDWVTIIKPLTKQILKQLTQSIRPQRILAILDEGYFLAWFQFVKA